jgi:C_GCAxxG_C_C family probable redox protein
MAESISRRVGAHRIGPPERAGDRSALRSVAAIVPLHADRERRSPPAREPGKIDTGRVNANDAPAAAVARARELFLRDDTVYGCAETVFVVLKEAYGLPDAGASSPAFALNGGLAYSGSTCGAITGAALAVGLLAERDVPDRGAAKRGARLAVADTLRAFEAEFGATTCGELTGFDLSTEAGHQAFIESGAWRTGCMRQIEFVVGLLAARTEAVEPR